MRDYEQLGDGDDLTDIENHDIVALLVRDGGRNRLCFDERRL